MPNFKILRCFITLFVLIPMIQGCGTQGSSSQQQLRIPSSGNSGQAHSTHSWTRTTTEQDDSRPPEGDTGKNNTGTGNNNSVTDSDPMVLLYSFFGDVSVNHILVKDPDELVDLDEYVRTHETIQVFANDNNGTRQALYRCSVLFLGEKVNHFASLQEDCEGEHINTEDLYGYVEPQQTAMTPRPLYRMTHPERLDHVITFDISFYMNEGYYLEFVLGYLPAK